MVLANMHCLQLLPQLPEDQAAKLHLCSKFLETFTRAKERGSCFAELSIDLLVIMREIILIDRVVGILLLFLWNFICLDLKFINQNC